MKRITIATILTISLALGGCSSMSDTEKRTMGGAAIGAGAGAAVGAVAGNTAVGAIVGTAAGTAGGYLYDQHKKSEEKADKEDKTE